jgi:hypothetical protein
MEARRDMAAAQRRPRVAYSARENSNKDSKETAMRTHIFMAIAALTVLLAWQSTYPTTAQARQAHSYSYCWQRAYNRGWERNTHGERQFIRRCMRGQAQ